MISINPFTPFIRLRPHLKFIVVADAKTGKPLSIFFDESLPDIHFELYMAAQKIYEPLNIEIRCQGGGYLSVVENKVIFYGSSQYFGRYENETVLALAPRHPVFQNSALNYISKAGERDPGKLI